MVDGADLTKLVLEEIPAVGMLRREYESRRMVTLFATGRSIKLSGLPIGVRRVEQRL